MDNPFKSESQSKKEKIVRVFKNPWVISAILLAGSLLVVGLSINSVMQTLLHSREEIVVPNLEGKNINEALEILSRLKLSLRQESTENDDTLPAGTVVRQHPPSGMKVREGRTINVVISMGGEAVFVPEVVNYPLIEVQSLLSQQKLQVGSVSEIYSNDVAEGNVVTQAPSSGTIVTRGAMVDLTVSKGPPPVGAPIMPNFIGRTVDNVNMWAEGVNAKVKITEDAQAPGTPGQVIRQTPPPDQPVLEGDILRVTIVPVVQSQNGVRISYQVPGQNDVTVRFVSRNASGESEVYKGAHAGGERLEIPLTVSEITRVRIFVDDILQEERVVEP